MKIDLSSCSVVELGKDCSMRVTGPATLVGIRGQQWATIGGRPDDILMVAGSELAVGKGEQSLIIGLQSGAVRVLDPAGRTNPPARWYEAFTRRWIGWFSEEAARRHAERQWGVL